MAGFIRDDIFDRPQSVVDFRFDERVAAVFPDMIHRSVPGYATLLQLLAVVGKHFVPSGGHVYDLGCSLGGATIALYPHLPKEVHVDAVDLSPAMVDRFGEFVAGSGMSNVHVTQGDILELDLQPCHLVMMNFTLQFIAPDLRDDLLKRIYAALQPGGALLLSEKTRPEHDDLRVWHEAFKSAQGYSDMAIAQKRESLENVMQTDCVSASEARLCNAGFSRVERYFQALQFCGWVAIK